MVEIPCLESSFRTLSVDGGFSPNGNGNHGLLIASFTTLSITSSACTTHTNKINQFFCIDYHKIRRYNNMNLLAADRKNSVTHCFYSDDFPLCYENQVHSALKTVMIYRCMIFYHQS